MITINPTKITRIKPISFGNKSNDENNRVGLMALDKNANNKINFEKDLFITTNADTVQTNPLKAIGYNFVKAYNILCTPKSNLKSNTESNFIPYLA